MKVIVDSALRVREFGRRGGFKSNEIRFYYQVVDYNCLVLRADDLDYDEWLGKAAIALFNFDNVNGQAILREFPGAPSSWSGADLIQVTLRHDRNVLVRPKMRLSEAVRQMLGDGC